MFDQPEVPVDVSEYSRDEIERRTSLDEPYRVFAPRSFGEESLGRIAETADREHVWVYDVYQNVWVYEPVSRHFENIDTVNGGAHFGATLSEPLVQAAWRMVTPVLYHTHPSAVAKALYSHAAGEPYGKEYLHVGLAIPSPDDLESLSGLGKFGVHESCIVTAEGVTSVTFNSAIGEIKNSAGLEMSAFKEQIMAEIEKRGVLCAINYVLAQFNANAEGVFTFSYREHQGLH